MSVTEAVKAGLVLAELNDMLSRKNVTIASGQNLAYGMVVGKITADGKYKAYDDDNNDGSETAAGILVGSDVDATDGDMPGVILVKDARVNADLVIWPSTNDATDITNGKADLASLGIEFRTGV